MQFSKVQHVRRKKQQNKKKTNEESQTENQQPRNKVTVHALNFKGWYRTQRFKYFIFLEVFLTLSVEN